MIVGARAKDEARLRWLLRDLFALFEKARRSETSVPPEEAFDGNLLEEYRALEERAKKLGVSP